MKMIAMSILLFSTLFSSAYSEETMNGSELILKKDLTVEANSTKHFGKKEIYGSGCSLVVQNRFEKNLTIAKGTVLVVHKVVSGVKRIDPGFPESEAITHILMHIQETENESTMQNNVILSLSCESGIYFTKEEAFMGYVTPQKVLKKYKDFIVQSK